MTLLRKKRLLILASKPNICHKKWYRQYCILQSEGLITWQLGFASITKEGIDYLNDI